MFEDKGKLTLPMLRQVILVLVFGIGYLFFSGPNLADEALLPSDNGYMLIRIKLTPRERVGTIVMSNVDTNDVIRIRGKSFEAAGVNAWIALVAMPNGRYFLSEYQPIFGIVGGEVQRLNRRYRWSAPESASDTFEIVRGMVNYAGDWELRVESSSRMELNPIIEFDKSTLERYVTQYPEYSNRYKIYLSPMGEKAISLDELVK
jgi:hypothetical protein